MSGFLSEPSLAGAARALIAAGLSVIPVGARKRPIMESWKPYQLAPPDGDEAAHWFCSNGVPAAPALAVVCGAVSGNLTVIDFDLADGEERAIADARYELWCILVDELLPGVLDQLPLVHTSGGGYHIYFRSPACEGSTKLATSADLKPKTWIETRGEGGYVVAPPSTGYKIARGTLRAIPTISIAAREVLLQAARSLHAGEPEQEQTVAAPTHANGSMILPGDEYNSRTSAADLALLLAHHGWTILADRGGTIRLRRPGKRDGLSATIRCGAGIPVFYPFTSNGAPFDMGRGYSPFGVYTLLEHAGDYQSAARALAGQGLGRAHSADADPPTSPTATEVAPRAGPRRPEQPPPEEPWFVPQRQQAPMAFDPAWLLSPTLVSLVRTLTYVGQWPAEFLAAPLLSVCGAMIGTSAVLEINDTWREFPCLWTCVVGEPGSGKTPALRQITSPLFGMQRQFHAAWKEARDEYDRTLIAWEGGSKANRGDRPQKPVQRKLLISDITLERLMPVLESNPRGVLLEMDELLGWVLSFGQYKKGGGGDRQIWLSIWSSKSLAIDRKTDDFSVLLSDPFVGVTGGIQPDRLAELHASGEDGLADRLLLFWPDAPPHPVSKARVAPETRWSYVELLQRLQRIEANHDEPDRRQPRVYTLAPPAFEAFAARDWAMQQLRLDEQLPRGLRNALAKMSAHAARLALVLHLCQWCDECAVEELTINVATVDAAWRICECAASHLRRIFAMAERGEEDEQADRLVAWMRRQGGSATVRDIVRSNVSGIKTATAARTALYDLADRHLVALTEAEFPRGTQLRASLPAGLEVDA